MSASARRLRNLFFVVLGLLVLLNVFIYPHDPHFGLDRIPGFWSLFGLAGAVILGKGAKGLAHTVLGKPENYYEAGEKGSRVQRSEGSSAAGAGPNVSH
ncbi:MAG: hypothetical protein ACM3KE_13255 [Hyphomicrobiales bacterium]